MTDDIALWLTHSLYNGITGWPDCAVGADREFFRAVQIATKSEDGPYDVNDIEYISIQELSDVVKMLQASEHPLFRDGRIKMVCIITMNAINTAADYDKYIVAEHAPKKRRRID